MTIDLDSRESVVDPAGYFGRHLEHGDVQWSDLHRSWVVLGHQAVSDAFRDAEALSADRVSVLERVASDRPDAFRVVVELLSGWMIFRDPPIHTRLRVPVRSAFTTRRVHELGPLVDQIVGEAFDSMVDAADGDTADLTAHVARPVPALVIGALLDVAPEDRPQLQQWSDALAGIVFSLSPAATPADGVVTAAEAFRDFFAPLVQDSMDGRNDESDESDGLVAKIARLGDDFDTTELIGMCTMLLFAGHETTTSLIQAITATLLERPDLERRLRDQPVLVDTAVEEIMRVQGPARTMVRKARTDHHRSGHEIAAGDRIMLAIAAANHDPRVFDEPAELDIARHPNPHLGFGWGLHHCLGAQLARAEATSFLRQLLERFDHLEPAGDIPPLEGAALGFRRGTIRLRVREAGRDVPQSRDRD